MTIWHPKLESFSGPKYLSIAQALAEDIRQGHLAPGTRLPPQRELADLLGVTVGTVTRAFREAARMGLLTGEVGRGTYVQKGNVGLEALIRTQDVLDRRVNLTHAGPSVILNRETIRQGFARLAENPPMDGLIFYPPEGGLLEHRAAGARYIQQTCPDASPDRVVLTSGGQNGLAVTLSALLKPHDSLLVDELTYPGIKGIAAMFHYKLVPLAMDNEGILPRALEAAARNGGAKVLYLQSTMHNPTSAVMGQHRREQVARIARQYDLKVVEDNVYEFLEPEAPPPVVNLIPERTYYIVSLSKCLMPGLRVGFVLAPQGEQSRVAAGVQALNLMISAINAELAAMWINDGTVAKLQEKQRSEAAVLQGIVRDLLGEFDYSAHPHGFIVWLPLPNGWEEELFVAQAAEKGVIVPPGSAFAVGRNRAEPAVRISLSGGKTREETIKGLRILREILLQPPAPSFSVG